MKISQKGIDLIKGFEAWSATTYICPSGYPTIGWGHRIKKGEVFQEPITPEIGEDLIRSDTGLAEETINKLCGDTLTQNEFDALVSFVFNIGTGNFLISTMLVCLDKGLYNLAADQFLRWVYGTVKGEKVKLPGLVERRKKEKELFLKKEEA